MMRLLTLKKGNAEKTKFRTTVTWKKWRDFMKQESNGIDYVTHKKLYKTWNLHHLDESIENYQVLTVDRFVALNHQTHEMVEWLWKYYRKDPKVIDRLLDVMKRMAEFECCNNIERH